MVLRALHRARRHCAASPSTQRRVARRPCGAKRPMHYLNQKQVESDQEIMMDSTIIRIRAELRRRTATQLATLYRFTDQTRRASNNSIASEELRQLVLDEINARTRAEIASLSRANMYNNL